MRLVTEDEARLAQIEHAKALTREIERLEQVARTNRVTLEWLADQQERWRAERDKAVAERDAALADARTAWQALWGLLIASALILAFSLAVLAARR